VVPRRYRVAIERPVPQPSAAPAGADRIVLEPALAEVMAGD
jgi:hypothetical protein